MTVRVTGRLSRFANSTTLEAEICCSCGVLFMAPEAMLDHCRGTGATFHCPNGHSLHYGSENAELKRKLQSERDRSARLAAQCGQIEASRRAYKGQATKRKRELERVKAGVCPCCNRSFQNLARHMGSQHPEFKT